MILYIVIDEFLKKGDHKKIMSTKELRLKRGIYFCILENSESKIVKRLVVD